MARHDSLQVGLGVLLVNLASVAVLWVAIPRVEGILLGMVALTMIAAFEAFTPLALTANHFAENIEAANRLFEIVDIPPAVTHPEKSQETPQKGRLRLNNVRFWYDENARPALDGITLTTEPNEHIAIVAFFLTHTGTCAVSDDDSQG